MRLGQAAGSIVQERLRGVKSGKVCFARGDIGNIQSRDGFRIGQMTARGNQLPGGFWGQMSIPSWRISPIRIVRSRYFPAGNGFAEIAAPVSSRMSVVIAPNGCSSFHRSV